MWTLVNKNPMNTIVIRCYKYHKPYSEIGVMFTNWANELGHHLVVFTGNITGKAPKHLMVKPRVSSDVPLNQSNDTTDGLVEISWDDKKVEKNSGFHGTFMDISGEDHWKIIGRSWERQEENLGKIQWDFVRIFRWIHLGTLWWTFTKSNGKSPFLMGKSTISMAIFNCYVSSPEGKWKLNSLTWNKAMLGMNPLTNHDYSEGEQWGRDQIYPDYIMDIFVEYSEDWMGWCDEYWWTIRLLIGK